MLQNPSRPNAISRLWPSNVRPSTPNIFGGRQSVSSIAALNIEFVAKPSEAHKIQSALPTAIQGAFAEVRGFAGGFVLVANYEARLVTVVTFWAGEDRMQRCAENLKWVRALLNPYLDRCLRVQTLAAYVPEGKAVVQELPAAGAIAELPLPQQEQEAVFAA